MASDAQPIDGGQAVIEQAEKMLAAQATITLEEASNRIRLYARFRDLRLIDVSRAVLDDTVRLLTMRENENVGRRSDRR